MSLVYCITDELILPDDAYFKQSRKRLGVGVHWKNLESSGTKIVINGSIVGKTMIDIPWDFFLSGLLH